MSVPSVPDEPRPEDRLRRIEQETERLERDLDHARDARDQARKADSMASPGSEHGVSEPRPQPEDTGQPGPDEAPDEPADPA